MRNTQNLEVTYFFLQDRAIYVEDGMQTYFPQFGTTETIRINKILEEIQPKSYAYNNGVIAFVDEDKNFYVIPNFKGTQKVLIEEGFKKDHFYVPFSNWDYPVCCEKHWDDLKKLQREELAE